MSRILPADFSDRSFPDAPPSLWRRMMRSGRVVVGGAILLLVAAACLVSLPRTLDPDLENHFYYDGGADNWDWRAPPAAAEPALWFGTDNLGRSLLARCLTGGAISLAIGLAAAVIAVVLGVSVGMVAGYRGGWTDAGLMRFVDVMYGLPYVLMIIILKISLENPLQKLFDPKVGNLIVLFLAIGLVSWLTMARVIRGQVLSLRGQPFIEAARAAGLTERRIFLHHLLPNLIGPILVYATLTVPQAILQESFLSFLGIGIQKPLPTWGSLTSEALEANAILGGRWWLLAFPSALLGLTLLCLNFVGDGLRDVLDPKRSSSRL